MDTLTIDVETETQSQKPRYSVSRKGIGGRKPSGIVAKNRSPFTSEVVQRVADRFAKGIPIRYALAGENDPRINLESWNSIVNKHPKVGTVVDNARFRWLEPQIQSLWDEKDWKARTWLMERRFLQDFAPPATQNVIINNDNRQVKLGIDEQGLAMLNQLALGEAKRLKALKVLK